MTAKSDWTEELTARFISLWDDPANYSAGEIGRRIGKTKSACTGKANRLNLAIRPSKANMRIGAISLTRKAIPGKAQRAAAQAGSKFDSARLVAVPIQRIREIIARPEIKFSPFKSCQFISGDVKENYLFCEEVSRAGSTYCAGHHKVCYLRVAA